jgi:hypothetical protein
MKTYTKETLIAKLVEVTQMGWIRNARPGNAGGIGNTLEDILGIEENNLPIPNAAEWELKCQRITTSSLTTLFHMEPSPRALKFVPEIFLPLYGWKHRTIANEMSFRQTIHGLARSDRGFGVIIDRQNRKVLISFDHSVVGEKHKDWLNSVGGRSGLHEIDPQPYWGFDDLHHKAGTKLLNCFYIRAKTKREKRKEYFKYASILILERFDFEKFLKAIESAAVLIDFDARTHHNHGTKFRLRQDRLPDLYETVRQIV